MSKFNGGRARRGNTMIHNGRYTAEFDSDNSVLIISRPAGGGVYLTGNKAREWNEGIQTAKGKREADALCKALLDSRD